MTVRLSRGRRPLSRGGYTLLEILLAAAIGVLLMGALYAAVSVHLREAQAARDVVERGTLVRALFARITADIYASLGQANPVVSSTSAGAAGTGGAGGSAGGSPTSGGTGSTATAATSGSSGLPATTGGGSSGVVINMGVQGTDSQMTLSISRVPREVLPFLTSDPTVLPPAGVSDLRLVSYWLAGGGDAPLGLARLEYRPVTSLDAQNNVPPNIADEANDVIAEEVKSVQFSYFDGNTWQDTWDGTAPGPDGVTPMGPPMAIAVELGIAMPGAREPKTYRHVIAIPTAGNVLNSSSGATVSGSGGTGS